MSLKYFKLSQNIIGKKRYWFNQDEGQLSKLPFYSFDQFLIDNNLSLIELVENNRNINISSNTNSVTITFNSENEIFDYLIVEVNGNRRYYYCNVPAAILNNTGAVTLHFILDEWMTFAYDYTRTLYSNQQKVAAIRSQKPRYLKNQNGSIGFVKKIVNGSKVYEKLNNIAQYETFSTTINDWYRHLSDSVLCGHITWHPTRAENKYGADYSQLQQNQKIYYKNANLGLKINGGSVVIKDSTTQEEIVRFRFVRQQVEANNFVINAGNFSFDGTTHNMPSSTSQSTITAIFTTNGINEFNFTFSLIPLNSNIFNIKYNNGWVLSIDPNQTYAVYIKTSIPYSQERTIECDLDISIIFSKELEFYSDIEVLGPQNTYYIDENLQLELKNKEINAETYTAENKIYKNDDFFKNISNELNIIHNPTLEYRFEETPFYENDGSEVSQRVIHNLNTLFGGDVAPTLPVTIKSLLLSSSSITTDNYYVDIFKQDDNTYKYLVIGADAVLSSSGYSENIKNTNQLFFLIPIINEKLFKVRSYGDSEIVNNFLGSSTITTSKIWGINNSWYSLNSASTIYQSENRIGVFTSKISPIVFAYTNKNVIRKIYQFSKQEPWTTFENIQNLYIGTTTINTRNQEANRTSSLGVIIIDCLPSDIYLDDQPLFIQKINSLLRNINDVEQPPLIVKENEPMLLTSSYSNLKYKADINNETTLSLPFIDTRYMIDEFSINYFIIQAMYLRLSINNWNPHKELSTTADEITVIDNKFVPSQTTAFAEYLNNSATTWDTQRKNATNSLGANVGITAGLTLLGIILAALTAGAATPISATMIGLGATGMAFNGLGNIGKAGVGYSNSLRSINSEIQNKQIETNQTSLPTFAGGLSGSSLWNKNMNGLPLLTTSLNPSAEDEIFNKRNIYGVKRFNQQMAFNEMDVRQHFNFILVDTSYNLGDIIACIKSSNKFSANYNEWIVTYISKYLGAGMLLMNEPIDDLLNDTENYEWEFTTTRNNRIK